MKISTYIYIFIAAICFATGEPILKLAGNALSPLEVNFLRFLIGGIVLLPFSFYERKVGNFSKLRIKDFMSFIFFGILLIPIDMVLFQYALKFANAGIVALIFSANPVFTFILAHFFTTHDKFSKPKLFSIFFTIVGIFFIISPWNIGKGNTFLGILLSILAAILFALYSVLITKNVKRVGTITHTSFSFIVGSIFMLPILFFLKEPVLSGVTSHPFLVLYSGIVISGIGYLTYFFAIKNSSPSKAGTVFFIKIILAPFLAMLILGETFSFSKIIGIVAIVFASFLLNFNLSLHNKSM